MIIRGRIFYLLIIISNTNNLWVNVKYFHFLRDDDEYYSSGGRNDVMMYVENAVNTNFNNRKMYQFFIILLLEPLNVYLKYLGIILCEYEVPR